MSDMNLWRRDFLKAGVGGVLLAGVGSQTTTADTDDEDVLLDEDFREYEPGDFPTGWDTAGNTDQEVVSSPSVSHDRAFRYSGSAGGCWEAIAQSPEESAIGSEGTTVISGDIRVGSGSHGCHSDTAQINISTCDDGWPCGKKQRFISFADTGRIEVSGADDDLGSWTQNKWYSFTITYERSDGQVTYTVEVEDEETTVEKEEGGFEDDISHLWLNTGGYTNYVDNLKITHNDSETSDGPGSGPFNAQNGLAINDGVAYIVSASRDGKIQQIDLEERTVIDAFDAPEGGRARGLAYVDGSLWFADGINPDYDGEILELNPDTGEIRSRIDSFYDPRGLAYGEGSLWVVDITANDIVEYALDGTELGEFDIPTGTTTPRGLAYFDSSLWVGTIDGFLYKLSTDGALEETTGERDTTYGGLATTDTELYGPDENGELTILRTLSGTSPTDPPEEPILGTVTDSAGNQLSDTTVKFVDSSGTWVKSVSTNPEGSYETTLPVGATYDVTADKDGFQSESKQVTIAQGETSTVDFSLEELAALTIEDARLVQIVENTRIDSSAKGADEDDINSSVSPETPDLILGRNTAAIFDIAGPSDLSLTDNVEITVSGDNIPFVSAGSNSAQTTIIDDSVISDVVSGSSLVEEFAKRPKSDIEPKDILINENDNPHPVFEASDDISEVEIEIIPQEDGVSGDSVTLTRGSGSAGDFDFTSTPSLSIGFIPVDDYFGTREYGPMDSADYEDAVKKGVKYIRKVFPTTEVYYYNHPYNSGVQALAAPAPGSDEDNIIGDVAEEIISYRISKDMAEARFELDRQTPTKNIQKVSKAGIENSNQEIEHFDVTIAITPSDYFEQLNLGTTVGMHISSLIGEPVQPKICACAKVDANNRPSQTDGSTIMHEIGHHFLGKAFVGDVAQDTDRDKSPDPPDGRQGSDPAHAQDNLVSTKFDMSNDTSLPLRPSDDIDSAVSSYMSYADQKWADALSTQKLIDDAESDGFSPTPPVNPIELLPDANNLIIFGEVTDGDIEISFADTLDQSIRTAGVEDGVDIQIKDDDSSELVSQTLPQGLEAVFEESEELEPPLVGEDIIMGDVAFPAESAEVEITASSSSEGTDEKITKTIDTSSPVIADFSISSESAIANKSTVFDAGSSFVKNASETVEKYKWDWTNDGEFETETDTPSTGHIFPSKGEYTVRFQVKDKNGNTATTSRTISVAAEGDQRSVEDYVEDEQVKLNGLREAIADWRTSEISDALLADVTAAWRSQDNVN